MIPALLFYAVAERQLIGGLTMPTPRRAERPPRDGPDDRVRAVWSRPPGPWMKG